MTRAEKFAQLLTEAVYRIRVQESKTIRIVQDELGYALGKQGGASIEHWRKGNTPPKPSDVELLAREIVRRSDLDRSWLQAFLHHSGHPDPAAVLARLTAPQMSGGSDKAAPPAATSSPVNGLPLQPTPFIGREADLIEICRHLDDPSCRLLTLVGPGGIGKTRLALQVAATKTAAFKHGIYFVPVSSLSSTDFLVAAVADATNLSFFSGESPKAQLLSYLQAKEMLLIIDNFEHLIQGVGLLVEIFQSAPGVKILVTSRERLNLRGEWVFEVRGMPVPTKTAVEAAVDEGEIEQYSSVQLFLQSARRVRSDLTLAEKEKPFVVRICQLVEGIPLGIELAAAWVKMLSCEEIAREIEHNYDFLATSYRDMPERHRSLQAVFDYSWDLLPEREREVMRKLAVFRGGFGRQAAAHVAGASLLTLSALVDKSFLQRKPAAAEKSAGREAEMRYEMHELLRHYAEEKLSEGGYKARERHGQYFATFLHDRKGHLRGGKQRETLEEITEEIENVRAAWRWAIRWSRQKEIGESLATLFYFYDIRGWGQEGLDAFTRAVACLRRLAQAAGITAAATQLILAQAVARQGRFYHRLGQYDRAKALLEESLAIFKMQGNQEGIALSFNYLGRIAYRMGEYLEAKRICRRSLAIWRQIGYQWGMVSALETLGIVAEGLGEYTEANLRFQEGLEICRQIGDRRGVAAFLNGSGFVQWRLGAYQQAEALCRESLEIYREIGDRRGLVVAFKNLGNVASNIGDYPQASHHYHEGLAIAREIGYQWGIAAMLNNLGNIAWERERYNDAKQYCQESLAIWRRMGDQLGVAGSLDTLGNVAVALHEWPQADAYFRAALEIALDIQAIPLLLDVLVAMTQLLIHKGEKEQTLEILTFLGRHPAIDKEVADEAAALFDELAADFPPAIVARARQRGRTRELDEVVTSMLGLYG